MKTLIFAALISQATFQTALAGETGTINQAGMYEQTMRFYLHPAHGFSDAEAAARMNDHPAVTANSRAVAFGYTGSAQTDSGPAFVGSGAVPARTMSRE